MAMYVASPHVVLVAVEREEMYAHHSVFGLSERPSGSRHMPILPARSRHLPMHLHQPRPHAASTVLCPLQGASLLYVPCGMLGSMQRCTGVRLPA